MFKALGEHYILTIVACFVGILLGGVVTLADYYLCAPGAPHRPGDLPPGILAIVGSLAALLCIWGMMSEPGGEPKDKEAP